MQVKTRNVKTVFLSSLLSLVLAAGLFFGVGTGVALAGVQGDTLEAVKKSDVGFEDDEDIKVGAQSANVLFFLDTSHSMMFEPRGKLPYVVADSNGVIDDAATKKRYGYDKKEAIDMMKYATFGVGIVPPVDSYYISRIFQGVHYGRDTDERNNLGYGGGSLKVEDPENYYRYYSPYPNAKHNLWPEAFYNQYDAYPGTDRKSGLGYGYKYEDSIKSNMPLPYMLVFKNPKYWEKGMPGFDPKNPQHQEELVPNDSRMYQTKLVLWRLLEDKVLFSNIRFGLAVCYSNAFTPRSEYGFTNDYPSQGDTRKMKAESDAYKVSPWGADSTYKNGAYYLSITEATGSKNSYTTAYSNQNAGGVQGESWGLVDLKGTYREGNLQQRAFLAVPIAAYEKVWRTKDRRVVISHADRFRQWIDGIEDIAGQYQFGGNDRAFRHVLNSGQFAIHKNPELKASNSNPIARAIFPNPDGSEYTYTNDPKWTWYLRSQGIAYAKRDSIFYGPGMQYEKYNFYFKPGSGEAVGSVIDFFSPYKNFQNGVGNLGYTNGSNAGDDASESFADMIDEQFPIRNVCDPNYLILFTAGDNSLSDYPSEKAIKALYDHTKKTDVTMMYYENGQRKFKQARLRQPIKTLVVGFVDPNDNSANSKKLRERLERMARAGDPEDPYAKPFLANDAASLVAALREVIHKINSDMQPGKGALLEGDSFSTGGQGGEEKWNIYKASFMMRLYDQWEGELVKYATTKNPVTGAVTTTKGGELGARLIKARDKDSFNPRKLVYWNGVSPALENVGFVSFSDGVKTKPHKLAELIGLGDDIVKSMDMSQIPGGNFKGKTHISNAMLNWYYGYNVSYTAGNYGAYLPRTDMLADQGRSGIVMVKPPARTASLPGFAEFAESLKNIKPKIFTQTNDGVLHVVDPDSMNETMGILPPPTLLPYRMFTLKTSMSSGKYRWIDSQANGSASVGGKPLDSVPSYLLDGPLQIRHFNLGNNNTGSWKWQTLLCGTLGKGGSGIYAMNVTDPAKPTFYWYRETIEKDDGSVSLVWRSSEGPAPSRARHPAAPFIKKIERGKTYWTDVFASPQKHAYEQLGFNSPKPAFGVVRVQDAIRGDDYKYRNLIALPGGMQNKLDPQDNGKMGAVMYLMDPDAAFHKEQNPDGGVMVLNSGSLKKSPPAWREGTDVTGSDPYMGMAISEPVFRTALDSKYLSKGMFFSDNLGRVFYVNFTDPVTGTPLKQPADWGIRTVASLRSSKDAKTDCYSMPSGVRVGALNRNPERLWVAGGTSDVTRADPTPGNDDSQRMKNKSQMIFAFTMPDLVNGKMAKRDNWTRLDPEKGDSGISSKEEGWYIPLAQAKKEWKDEYVTARPELFGGNLYVAAFQQSTINTNSSTTCETRKINGVSRLYVLSLETGRSSLWGNGNKKYLQFDGIKIAGLTVSTKGGVQTLLVSYEVLDQSAAEKSIKQHTGSEESLTKVAGMDALSIKMFDGDKTGRVKENDSVVEYWRMWQPAGK